jgi:hypothetical protein
MAFRSKGSHPRTVVGLAGMSLLVAVACGYHLGAYSCESDLMAKNIAIPLFQNLSHEPRFENLLTEAFRDRIHTLPCVSLCSRKRADALLKGQILSVESNMVAVDEEFFAMEYRMRVVMAVSLVRSEDGEVLWRDGSLQEEVSFYASSDPLLFKDNREEALMDLASRMSERVVDRILLGF